MSPLTKEQVQKLTPEQQAAFATMLTTHAQWRQELLNQCRQQWSYRIAAGVILLTALALAIFQAGKTPFPSMCIVLLAILVQLHASLIHRRLDAVLELFSATAKPPVRTDEPAP